MSFKVSSVKEYFDTLGDRFVAEKAKGMDTIYQFELSGDEGGTYHVHVKEGAMTVVEGAHDKPTSTLKMSGEDYVKMTNGEINGQMAYMKGKMKISGSIPMAMKMKNIFPQA